MNNVVLGQYIPGNSYLHKLDARIKMISLFLFVFTIFFSPTITELLIILSLLVTLILTSGISIFKVIKGLKPIVVLLLFTFSLQIMSFQTGELLYLAPMSISAYTILALVGLFIFYNLTKKYISLKLTYFMLFLFSIFFIQSMSFGDNVFVSYNIKIYEDGLFKALYIFLKILNMIILSSILTFTTSHTELNYAIEKILKPIPLVNEEVISMMISITLRWIPKLMEETIKIMDAQASRGVDFNEASLKKKIEQLISLLIPILVLSIRNAIDLANTMEVRGYVVGEKRTNFHKFSIGLRDILAIFLVVSFLTTIIIGDFNAF